MNIQQLNLRAMIEFAARYGPVRFTWQGLDPQLQAIHRSAYTRVVIQQYIASLDYVTDKKQYFDLWVYGWELENWSPFTQAEYVAAANSRNEADWRPGPLGSLQTGGLNWLGFLVEITDGLKFPDPIQPPLRHLPRNLHWVDIHLWDVFAGIDNQEFIRSLYQRKINGEVGGWLME